MLSWLSFLWCFVSLSVVDAKAPKGKSTEGGSKACSHTGFYSKKIVPLCQAHFPDEVSKHVWVVQFYHQSVNKVVAGKSAFEGLAKIADELDVKIGAVDCQHNQEFCAKKSISEAPVTRVILEGQKRDYTGDHDLESLKAFIKESVDKLQEVKCEVKGVFNDLNKDSVVPLCTGSLPPADGPVPWMVAFYEAGDRNKDKTLRSTLNKLADKFGNVPPMKTGGKKKALKLKIGAVDCGHTDSDCAKFEVTSFPTIRFYASGAEPKTFDSFFDSDEIKTWAGERLKEAALPKPKLEVPQDMPNAGEEL